MDRQLDKAQEGEITEHNVYRRLALREKNPHNRQILESISQDEFRHYGILKKITKKDQNINYFKLYYYYFIAVLLGLTFALKLMERGELRAQKFYGQMVKSYKELTVMLHDEEEHEHKLIKLLNEERLRYVGSLVLGLNDALVELTGALAGYTFALGNSSLIAITGLITGIAAAMSMAASEFQSQRAEQGKNAGKAAIYTGTMYLITVILLIIPYFLFSNVYVSLAVTMFIVVLTILGFTFYVSVAMDKSFWKRFAEMVAISIGVAAITFGIGYLVQKFLGVSL